MKLEVLVYEITCGSRKLGEELHLCVDGNPIAKLSDTSVTARGLANDICETMNYEPASDGRPPKLIRMDRGARHEAECARNREHIAKTITVNMRGCYEKVELLRLCTKDAANGHQGSGERARTLASEMYGCRQYVLGIIDGRGYALAEAEREQYKHEWEKLWDETFGDSVSAGLNAKD